MRALKKTVGLSQPPLNSQKSLASNGFGAYIFTIHGGFPSLKRWISWSSIAQRIVLSYDVSWCLMLRVPCCHVSYPQHCPSRFHICRLKCKLIDMHFLKHWNWNWKEPWNKKITFFLAIPIWAINLLSCPMLPACSIYISNPSSVALLCTYLHLCGEHHCGIVHFFRSWLVAHADRTSIATPMNFSILRSWHLVRKFMR